MDKTRKQTGEEGERQAEKFLMAAGYVIVGRNLRSPYGEIDLVAQRDDSLYFVEIKKRVGVEPGSALEAVSDEKMRRIKKTVEVVLSKNAAWRGMIPFLSVLAIDETPDGETHIEFLPDAFE